MKKFYIFISLALFAGTVSARQISEAEALAIAASKLPSIDKSVARIKANDNAKNNATAPVYLFNSSKGGFVIVAGDDRMPNMVLAYSESGYLDFENCSPAFQSWLNEWTEFISAGNFSSIRRSPLDYSTPVAPLISSKWNQGDPYDLLTPMGSTGEHCPTGCAATAMAQIMNYWEYPKDGGFGENSYEWNGQTLSADFRASIYDWDNMADVYDENSTEAQNNAVAKLMLDCGIASNMDYGDDESGTQDIMVAKGLVDYLGYNPGLELCSRDFIPDDEWFELVKNELDQKQPVFFTGATPNQEGHAFVCDGYDTDGLYHINWGWGGLCDGYFDLNTLDPDIQGIGGASSGQGFSCSQSIIAGLRPAKEGDEAGYGWVLAVEDFELTINEDDGSTFDISFNLMNYGFRPFEGAIGLGLTLDSDPENTEVEILDEVYGENAILPYTGSSLELPGLSASDFEDGVYTLSFYAIVGEDVIEALTPVKDAPMSFEIKDGKVIHETLPQLYIDEIEIEEMGFYYTIGGAIRGLLSTLTFNVENTSNVWFTSALEVKVEYTNGVFADTNSEIYHLRDIPEIGPGQVCQISIPIQYNVKGNVTIVIDTTNRSTETPQKAIFTNNEISFVADEFYHELELEAMPEVAEAGSNVTITAEVISVTGSVDMTDVPTPNLEEVIEKEIVCTIYPEGSEQPVASAKAIYTGKFNEVKELVFSPEETLENGNYVAVFTYQSVPNLFGQTLDIVLGDELEEYPGLQFEITTSGIADIKVDSSIEIFTLNGVRITDARSLAPGFYIVRQGENVSKVAVK